MSMFTLGETTQYALGEDNNILITGHNLGVIPALKVTDVEVANRDGSEVVESKFNSKKIVISGLIHDTSKNALDLRVQTFKQNVILQNDYLYYSYGGSTLCYKVYTTNLDWEEPFKDSKVKKFTIELTAYDPPFALDISETTAKSVSSISSQIYSDSVSFSGTTSPKPVIKITFTDSDSLTGIELINKTTASRIQVDENFVNDDVLKIDTENMEVTLNGDPIDFEGLLPEFDVGTNSIVLNSYTDSGIKLDQSQKLWNRGKVIYGNKQIAQSFQIPATATVPRIDLIIEKVGNPTGDITLEIQTDNSDVPSGSVVTNGSTTIAKEDITTKPIWITALFDIWPSLTLTTAYHIVIYTSGGDEDNYYVVKYNATSVYDDGQVSFSIDAGANWTEQATYDIAFKIFTSAVDQQNQGTTENPYEEDFDDDTYEDNVNTTANWDTVLERLRLNINNQLTFGTSGNVVQNSSTTVSDFDICSISGTNKVFIAYNDRNDNKGKAVIGTISNNTITLRTPVEIYAGTIRYIVCEYDPDTGKILVCYNRDNKLKSIVATVSDSISFGSEVEISSTNFIYKSLTYDTNNDKFVLSYSGGAYGYGIVGTISGSSVNWGSATQFTNNANHVSSCFDSTNEKIFISYGTGSAFKCIIGTVSGTSISFGSEVEISSTNYSSSTCSFDSINEKVVVFYYKYSIVGTVSGSSISFGSEVEFDSSSSTVYEGSSYYDTDTGYIIVLYRDTAGNKIKSIVGSVDGDSINFGTYSTLAGVATLNTKITYNSYTQQAGILYFDYSNGYIKHNIGYLGYNTTDKIVRSIDLATVNFGIISGKINKIDNTPINTSINYYLSNDGGSSFESVTPDVWKIFDTINSSNKNIRFKVELNGISASTPYVDILNVYYRLGGILNNTNNRLSQGFTPEFTGDLGRVDLYLAKKGSPGNLTVEIYANSGGKPTGAALASQIISASSISTTPNWVICNFDTPYSVTSGTVYHIVVKGASVDTSNLYIWCVRSGNPYADGQACYSTDSGTNYSAEADYDFNFATYASSLTFDVGMTITYVKRYLL